MIVHRKTQLRKKYIHGRGLVIRLNTPKLTASKDSNSQENAKKAASEIKYGNGFQIL
jgi:hypothetical protein